MGRVYTAGDFAALVAGHYEIHGRLRIENTLIENILGVNPFLSATITSDLTAPVINATFRCHSGTGLANLSPLMSSGAQLSGRPLFDVSRSIAFETSCDLPGTGPSNWRRVFEGGIDTVSVTDNGNEIVVEARDSVAVRLQTKWIDIVSTTDQGPQFGFPVTGARVDVAMQSVLDQAYGGSYSEPFLTIGAPDLAITDYWQDPMLALDAIRRLGLQNGWDLRGKWDQSGYGIDTFILTYYSPDRDLTSGVTRIVPSTAGGEPIYDAITSCKLDASTVRNRIDVVPADATRVPQRAEDATSQLAYGLRTATISEDRASHIDTEAEALTLAQLILADSKDAKLNIEIEMRYFWLPEVNDVYTIAADGVHFDTDLLVGIQGYTHTLTEGGDGTTVLRTTTRPTATVNEWRRGVPRMQYSSLNEPVGPGVEGATWLQIEDDALPTVL